jgi:hypothetical protein
MLWCRQVATAARLAFIGLCVASIFLSIAHMAYATASAYPQPKVGPRQIFSSSDSHGVPSHVPATASTSAPPQASLLSPPTNLVAYWDVCESCCVRLTWDDRSQCEDGFGIERALGTEEEWHLIGTAGRNATSYDDCDQLECSLYLYRVYAYNAAGPSDYSNEVSVRPCGRCFIATAAYGSPFERHVETLRAFRDSHLTANPVGQGLAAAYETVSPPIARFIGAHPALKPVVRGALMPAVGITEVAVATGPVTKGAIGGLVFAGCTVAAAWLVRRMAGAGLRPGAG